MTMTMTEYRAVLADAAALTPGELSRAAYEANISPHVDAISSSRLAALAADAYETARAVPVAA